MAGQLAQEDLRRDAHQAAEGQPVGDGAQPSGKKRQWDVVAGEDQRDYGGERTDGASLEQPEGRNVEQDAVSDAGHGAER